MGIARQVFGHKKISRSALDRALAPRAYKYVPDTIKRAERRAAHCPCRLVMPSGEYLHGYLVDISDTGARIRLATHMRLPEFFHVKIPAFEIDQKVRRVWQGVFETGVTFT